MIGLSAFYSMKISKGGKTYDRDSFPIFFNSISRVFISERTGEIAQIEITLTPSFNDAIVILTSGLLGISIGTKEQLPNTKNTKITALPTTGSAPVTTPKTDQTMLSNEMDGFAKIEVTLLRPNDREDAHTNTFKGALTMPEVQISGANITITVKGYANAIFAMGPECVFDIKEMGGTVKSVIDKACLLMNYKTSIKEGHEGAVESGLAKKLELTPKTCTPYELIKWALSQVQCNFNERYTETNELEFMIYSNTKPMLEKIGTPAVTFVMWRQIDLDNKVYPLLDYTLESKQALFISGKSFGTYKLGTDEKLKAYLNNDLIKEDADVTNKKSALQETIANTKLYPGIQIYQPNQTSEVVSRQADTDTVVGNATYQRYSLVVLGNPYVKMLDQVKIMIGDIQELEGTVLITKVEHVFDESGWITNLEGTQIGSQGQDLQKKAP